MKNFAELDQHIRQHPDKEIANAWNEYLNHDRCKVIDGGKEFRTAMIWYHEMSHHHVVSLEERLWNAILGDYTIIAVTSEGKVMAESRHSKGNKNRLRQHKDWKLSGRFGETTGAHSQHQVLHPASFFRTYDQINATQGMDLLRRAGYQNDPGLMRLLLAYERSIARGVSDMLIARMEPQAIRLIRKLRLPRNDSIYNWLLHPDMQVRQRRRQAAEQFPFFCEVITSPGFNGVERCVELMKTIDDGLPLLTTLASVFQVKKATVNRLRYLGARELKSIVLIPIHRLISLMDRVPYAYWPVTAKEWRYAAAIMRDFPISAEYPFNTLLEHFSDELHKAGKRGWRRGMERYFSQFRYVSGWYDIRDLFRSVEGFLEIDGLEDMVEYHNKMMDWFSAFSVKELSALNEAWHRRQHLIELDDIEGESISWPALSDAFKHGNREIVSLVKTSQLFEEGRQLKHCVGGYTSRCVWQNVHILSCRDGSGVPQSTIEIRLNYALGTLIPQLIQHRGERNRKPSPACHRALSAYLKQLNQLNISHFERLEKARKKMLSGNAQARIDHLTKSHNIKILKSILSVEQFSDLKKLKSDIHSMSIAA